MLPVTEKASNVVPITDRPTRRKPPRAGMGRPKGSQNKISRSVREAIESAFVKVGGDDYLVEVARTEPAVFCALLARLLLVQASRTESRVGPDTTGTLSAVSQRIRMLLMGQRSQIGPHEADIPALGQPVCDRDGLRPQEL